MAEAQLWTVVGRHLEPRGSEAAAAEAQEEAGAERRLVTDLQLVVAEEALEAAAGQRLATG